MAMTYQTLFDTFFNQLKTLCWNVSNFTGLPAQFKTGYTTTQTSGLATFTWKISNPITQVTEDQLKTDVTQFFKDTRKIDLSATVTPRGLMNFYGAIACYCSSRIKAVGSLFNNNGSYVCAILNETIPTYTSIPDGIECVASDIQTLTTTINQIMGGSIRGYALKYTIS